MKLLFIWLYKHIIIMATWRLTLWPWTSEVATSSCQSQLCVFECIQAKCCDLDGRLVALSKDKQALKQKIDALQLNADKLNPNKKVVAKETVRYMHVLQCLWRNYIKLMSVPHAELFMLVWRHQRKWMLCCMSLMWWLMPPGPLPMTSESSPKTRTWRYIFFYSLFVS